MEITDNQDRRRNTRVEFSTRIVLMTSDAEIEAIGSSTDLSLTGVFVNTDKRLEAGSECNVKIFLSGGIGDIELAMKARVARVVDGGIGLSFEAMDLDTYTHLKNIVLYNS
ncbi:MAG: PilZ domain-containing protein [Desulfobacterium sp.]|nr:PilZ domain-containing protein [Desulfobacterium sp.]